MGEYTFGQIRNNDRYNLEKRRNEDILFVEFNPETGLPRFTATWSVGYRDGPLTVATNFRYTGSGPVDKTTLPTDLPQLNLLRH